MPCRDDRDDSSYGNASSYGEREINRRFKEGELTKAVLCAVLTTLERDGVLPFNPNSFGIDWKEAGVTQKEAAAWWKKHKEKDAVRRLAEAAEAAKERVRVAALAKLTSDERKVLGL